MKVLCGKTIKGDGRENQDTYGYSGNMFWVIDGATDLFGLNLFNAKDDVAHYVRALSSHLELRGGSNKPLAETLKEAITETNRSLGLDCSRIEPYKLPNFAIAIGRLTGDRCDYYVLGDCTLAISDAGGVHRITDRRIVRFSEKNRAAIREMKRLGTFRFENEREQYQETRKSMNQEDGYWIGSPDMGGIDKGYSGTVALGDNARILAFTDGLLEAFDMFKVASLDTMEYKKEGIEHVVDELHRIREQDSGREVARVRKQDDLTYILIEPRDRIREQIIEENLEYGDEDDRER